MINDFFVVQGALKSNNKNQIPIMFWTRKHKRIGVTSTETSPSDGLATTIIGGSDSGPVLPSIDAGPELSIEGIQDASVQDRSSPTVQQNATIESFDGDDLQLQAAVRANRINVDKNPVHTDTTPVETGENGVQRSCARASPEKLSGSHTTTDSLEQTIVPLSVLQVTSSISEGARSGEVSLDSPGLLATGFLTPNPVATSGMSDYSRGQSGPATGRFSMREGPSRSPTAISDYEMICTATPKRKDCETIRGANSSDHDHSAAGSTKVNTPVRRNLTPTPFELDFGARCRAARDVDPSFSSSSPPNTSSQAITPPHAGKLLVNVKQWHNSLVETPVLAYIDQIKADYSKEEGSDWMALRAWAELWHQAEVEELKKQISIAERITASREVDIANNKEDYEAELQVAKQNRANAMRTVKEQRAKLGNATKEKEIYLARLAIARKDVDGLKDEKEDLKSALETERETARLTKAQLEQQLHDKSAVIDRQLSLIQRLQSNVNFIQNGSPTAGEIFRLRNEVAALQQGRQDDDDVNFRLREVLDLVGAQLEEIEAENGRLMVENKGADLDVGFLHAMNAGYRANLEDADPARTAGLDARLKRMEEERKRLEGQVDANFAAFEAEKQARDIDREYHATEYREKDTNYRWLNDSLIAMTSSRDAYRQHNDEILEMLERKLDRDDVVDMLTKDKEISRQDNMQLLAIVEEHRNRIRDAKESEMSLLANIIKLTTAVTKANKEAEQTEIINNGLQIHVDRLNLREEIQEPFIKIVEDNKQLKVTTQKQKEQIDKMIQQGADKATLEQLTAKDQLIAEWQAKANQFYGYNQQLEQRELERQDGFCYLYHGDKVIDWTSKDMTTRLKFAEKTIGQLRQIIEERMGPEHLPWAQYKPCTEAEGPYYGEGNSMIGQAL